MYYILLKSPHLPFLSKEKMGRLSTFRVLISYFSFSTIRRNLKNYFNRLLKYILKF